ncbi:MAG TPA: hypothetical protein P5081_00350 [Phycisphaerae bacterium]|nr:hypothetical protein [Phycisphaerae bacterium]HRW51303.1 hypothetical protein [Phycisphaerae bacterium]
MIHWNAFRPIRISVAIWATAFMLISARHTLGADCNQNNVDDAVDIDPADPDGDGFVSLDCNANGLPDECEIGGDKLIASDAYGFDTFGAAVAIEGDDIVVGKGIEADGFYTGGAAYVFGPDAASWGQEDMLVGDDTDSDDIFGGAVALSGDTVVVGAPNADGAAPRSGAVYVFRKMGGVWAQEAKLIPSDGVAYDRFGESVSISDDTLVIGASGRDDLGRQSGAAYVFERTGATWSQGMALTAPDGAAWASFGARVAISNDTIVVGARWDNSVAQTSGSAYVFRYDGVEWRQEAKLTASDARFNGYFGENVAIDGDTIVIGATGHRAAYVFQRQGDTWREESKLTAPVGASTGGFGVAVAVSNGVAIIGASHASPSGGGSGAAFRFDRTGARWISNGMLEPFDAAAETGFGHCVSIDNDKAIVGALSWDQDTNLPGAAHVFNLVDSDCNANGIPDDCDAAGDLNGDGLVNLSDTDALVHQLLTGATCLLADLNSDGMIDGNDVGAFVALLVNP